MEIGSVFLNEPYREGLELTTFTYISATEVVSALFVTFAPILSNIMRFRDWTGQVCCSCGSLRLCGCYLYTTWFSGYNCPLLGSNRQVGKAMLNAWLRERTDLADCSQCNQQVKQSVGL
ncbi:hypothetical protein V6N11_035790 [Hibiscus sabdariffa]|uniref:Uncharacterized protein n=2 Tax=Hibiscus sabdariffa TaxID=183260 RepID=A0ABR1ZE49_9ROSI